MLVVVAVVGCALGLANGLRAGPLWLDETLSVEIARQTLPGLYEGLRQDGAPPVYYLVLKAWMSVFGTGTMAVRALSVLLVPVALLLAHRLGGRLGGRGGARAAVIVLAALPWTMRYGSETRMYLLVVVIVLAGALALHAVHSSGSRRSVLALGVLVGVLLLTHYWSLFLLAAVGLAHLPGLLRRRPASVRVAVSGLLGGLLFLPWAPTFLFQAGHTGAPWADPLTVLQFFATPTYWGGGSILARILLAVLIVPLAVLGARRSPALKMAGVVALTTLVLAWTTVYLGGGAYTGRYTAVVVPLVALLVAAGAVSLGGQRTVAALTAFVAIALVNGVPAAGRERTFAAEPTAEFRAVAAPGDLLVFCPDQLGPAINRLLGPGYDLVVYPSLEPASRIDWIDYEQRQDAADPAAIAGALDARAAGRPIFVLASQDYRTYEGDCERLLAELSTLRGGPPDMLYGNVKKRTQKLYRFAP